MHDKAIDELTIAYQSWQEANLEGMRPHIIRIQDIVSYLHSSLTPNMELTDTMAGLYRYYLIQLAKLFIEPNEELFAELKQYLVDWRETWWKAEQLTIEQV